MAQAQTQQQQASDVEAITEMSWDGLLNFALYKIIGEDEPSASRMRSRIKVLESLLTHEIDLESEDSKYQSKVQQKWDKLEQKYSGKEQREAALLELQFFKLQLLVQEMRSRIPEDDTAVMANIDEIHRWHEIISESEDDEDKDLNAGDGQSGADSDDEPAPETADGSSAATA